MRDASESDTNIIKSRSFPQCKATVHALDLFGLLAVHALVDQTSSNISSGKYPLLAAIIANAYDWNLVGDPEITADGFDKTFEVAHIAYSALILRLIGSFGEKGRVVLFSSDAHWPNKNSIEKYPPITTSNLDELIKPVSDADKQERCY